MTCGVYIILCTASGRYYVGSSVDIERRWNAHRAGLRRRGHHSEKLQRAWDKYGEWEFSLKIVARTQRSDRLASIEQRWIDRLDSFRRGYNVAPIAGGSVLGIKFGPPSAEKRRKLAAAQTGRRYSDESRAKMAAAKLGKGRGPPSDVTRLRMSLAQKGRIVSDKTRRLIRLARARQVIRPHSQRSREKISATLISATKRQRRAA